MSENQKKTQQPQVSCPDTSSSISQNIPAFLTTSDTSGDDNDDFDFFYDYAKAVQNRSEAWTEENWRTEMEKHPLFISQSPEPDQEQSALVQAMAQLKYDPEFNSPIELIGSYRLDGNENFKNGKYRWSINSYTEGIKIARRELAKFTKMKDTETKTTVAELQIIKVVSTLYNNRASAHFYLQNYRSSANDARLAVSLDPSNQKALVRVAKCLSSLHKYQEVIDYCQSIINSNNDDGRDNNLYDSEKQLNSMIIAARPDDNTKFEFKKIIELSTVELKKCQRDERKRNIAEEHKGASQRLIEEAVHARSIKYHGSLFESEHGAVVHGHFVHFDQNEMNDVDEFQKDSPITNPTKLSSLIWPVVFIYPEFGQTDFIQAFHECTTFREMFHELFSTSPEWDLTRRYKPEDLNVWYHSYEDERYSGLRLKQLNPNMTLGNALVAKGFVVTNAIPTFVVGLEKPKGG